MEEFDNFVVLGLNKDFSGCMLVRNMIAYSWIFGRDRREDKCKIVVFFCSVFEVCMIVNVVCDLFS